jgi:hypothetical protein
MAGQQENVDYIIGRIRTTLNESLNSPGWRAKYSLASKNIEDLRKTLALGGKISSNPVKEYNGVLTEMLEERKAEFKAYCDAQEKLDKSRKKAAKQAINDVGMEMINRITPKPGIFTPFSQARTKNAQVIKDDFARLRTIDEAIATLEQYKKNILPSIREIRDRRQALGPLLTQFASLTAGFDGTYKGRFQGEASGTITFTVKGKSVSGSLSGSYRGDSIQGRFSGIVDTHGNVSTSLSGSLTDMSKNRMGSFPFKGNVNGRINGVSGSGRWTAKNKWGAPAGGWSVSKN